MLGEIISGKKKKEKEKRKRMESRCMGRKGKFLLIVKALNGAEISTNNGNLGGGVHPFSQKWLSTHGDAFF